jgi:hypothetical protein
MCFMSCAACGLPMRMHRLPAVHCCTAARQCLHVCNRLHTVFTSPLIDGCCKAACNPCREICCKQWQEAAQINVTVSCSRPARLSSCEHMAVRDKIFTHAFHRVRQSGTLLTCRAEEQQSPMSCLRLQTPIAAHSSLTAPCKAASSSCMSPISPRSCAGLCGRDNSADGLVSDYPAAARNSTQR